MNIFLLSHLWREQTRYRVSLPLRPRNRPQRPISRTFYANILWLWPSGPWPGDLRALDRGAFAGGGERPKRIIKDGEEHGRHWPATRLERCSHVWWRNQKLQIKRFPAALPQTFHDVPFFLCFHCRYDAVRPVLCLHGCTICHSPQHCWSALLTPARKRCG